MGAVSRIRSLPRLSGTLFLAGLASSMLLGIVLMTLGKDEKHAVAAVSVFFLIGAMIGLLNRLRGESQSEAALEDYGPSAARLIATPFLSGMTAVFGVVLVEIAALNGAQAPKPCRRILNAYWNLLLISALT
jgi:hypothetical protein